jgi:8-oxo-dGTP pyrophosphatase MutT (NUDIX family)
MKHSHCHYCGTKYATASYPLHCEACKKSIWFNPLPVVVVAIPIKEKGNFENCEGYTHDYQRGYLGIQRGGEEAPGELAFPGGYVEAHETWQEAAEREVFEETGLRLQKRYGGQPDIHLDSVDSRDGFLVISCKASPVYDTLVDWTFTSVETQKVVLLKQPTKENPYELAFKVQTEFLNRLRFGQAY